MPRTSLLVAVFALVLQFSHNTRRPTVACQYPIPAEYEPVMQGFFTSYMTEVYKAGNDVDYYEKVLTSLFKKVLENMKEPHKFDPFHEAMREPFDYYALGACESHPTCPRANRNIGSVASFC